VTADDLKRAAAERALSAVADGMRLGLGTGSTAAHFVALLGARVRAGLNVVGVPTSERTRAQAAGEGIPLTTLEETPELDLTVMGPTSLTTRSASSRAAAARSCARRSWPPRAGA
jgi:ribose 5-phosphate isomerase A